MKNKQILFLGFILLLGFNSCVIREPETKPDFVSTGKRMFDYSQNNIYNFTRYFDKVLFLDAYSKTPDSLKQNFRDSYFPQYDIKKTDGNKWYIIRTSDSDTIYTVITDANSIQIPGAIWKLREQYTDSFCTVNCVSDQNWQLKATASQLNFWNLSAGLNFECTDNVAPLLYQTATFKITGGGSMLSAESYMQQVRISYQIKDALIHDSSSRTFTTGSIDVSAEELETKKYELTNGRYFLSSTNGSFYEITYHGRSQIYDNWSTDSFMW